MNKTIIFDFYRTIFDPESSKLVPGTKTVLKSLKRRGFRLFLVSREEKSRKELIQSLGISDTFEQILLVPQKTAADFLNILSTQKISLKNSFVVGDRVKEEIALGNQIGLTTIWVKTGKFSTEIPRTQTERPTFTVTKLKDILKVLK